MGNRLARYVGNGNVEIREEPEPECPEGGLLVQTEASGLCSGELMSWYMDRKVPHVLGHEVSGVVLQSGDARYPVGSRVFPHHHAPCMQCEHCRMERYVHCPTWRATKLTPGGMAERFAVPPENLTDTLITDDLRPVDAALIEPLACVEKAVRRAPTGPGERAAVIGLGVMGLMHMRVLGSDAVGYDLLAPRREWAAKLGMDARDPQSFEPADTVYLCPGNEAALQLALQMVRPGGTLSLFAPFPPHSEPQISLNQLYFHDVQVIPSYSCGPNDTALAAESLRQGLLRAEDVVSNFIALDELPAAYHAMKRGDILKAMVLFG